MWRREELGSGRQNNQHLDQAVVDSLVLGHLRITFDGEGYHMFFWLDPYCGSLLQGTETLYSVGAPQGKDGF